MEYSITANSVAHRKAAVNIKSSEFNFGIIAESSENLANPAELFLASLSACMLKNVERFSSFMQFEYARAELKIIATRLDKPPKIDEIKYELKIYTDDNSLNKALLKKNIEKFGTIYNTVKNSCSISGDILLHPID